MNASVFIHIEKKYNVRKELYTLEAKTAKDKFHNTF